MVVYAAARDTVACSRRPMLVQHMSVYAVHSAQPTNDDELEAL